MAHTLGLTVEEIADQYGIDAITVYRWSSTKAWLEAIVDTQDSTVRYDPDQVSELIHEAQGGHDAPLTVREIATKYKISLDTVHRWVRDEQWQKAMVGERGTAKEYDSVQVEALVREQIWMPPKETDIPADQLLSLKQIAEYVEVSYLDARKMAADLPERGSVLGEHDALEGKRRRWKRSTVDERLWGRQRRKKK